MESKTEDVLILLLPTKDGEWSPDKIDQTKEYQIEANMEVKEEFFTNEQNTYCKREVLSLTDNKNRDMKTTKKKFAEILIEKLQPLGIVSSDTMSDNSCHWVSLKIKDVELTFSFDKDKETFQDISLHKDIYEVVDQKRLWSSNPKLS